MFAENTRYSEYKATKPKKSSEADDQSQQRQADVMEGDDPNRLKEDKEAKETRDRGNVERTRTVSGERDPCARCSCSD